MAVVGIAGVRERSQSADRCTLFGKPSLIATVFVMLPSPSCRQREPIARAAHKAGCN